MNNYAVYIAGMFEDEKHPLFFEIKKFLKNIGWNCVFIKLYDNDKQFGSYSFKSEMERITDYIERIHPDLIVAHSIGGYIATQLSTRGFLFLLDPSLSVSDVILPNVKNGRYDDGKYVMDLSNEFLESIKTCASIEKNGKNIKQGENVFIFGAGKGGFKVAEQYHKNILDSHYFFLADANHDFSAAKDKKKIINLIKKRLGVKSPSRKVSDRIMSL
ncbi:MAG: hypothetical protein PHZ25_02295 [Candidatus Pacebacteria bacterium]|nr:hypothetical protein [Candidatus Paceibacterota bacterium]